MNLKYIFGKYIQKINKNKTIHEKYEKFTEQNIGRIKLKKLNIRYHDYTENKLNKYDHLFFQVESLHKIKTERDIIVVD